MIRVVVVDDHAVVREGLAMLLAGAGDIDVVATASDGAQAVEAAAAHRPDVMLMDLSMPVLDGVAATRAICDDPETSDVAVVVLTTFADTKRVMDSLEAGAVGYLMKDASPADLVAGVRAAVSGGSPLDPRVARSLIEAQRGPAPTRRASLTSKQAEVLDLVAQGMSNRQIARRLGISEKTVKTHLTSVYATLGVTDRVQAALWARQHGPPGA